MLRALLTARRYDIGEGMVEATVQFTEHHSFMRSVARILLERDCVAKRSVERGQAVLETLLQKKQQSVGRGAKRQRLTEALGARLEDPKAVEDLSQEFGTGRALDHQAQLWDVHPGKTKAATSRRILAAMQASRNPEGEAAAADEAAAEQGGDDDEDFFDDALI